VQIVQIREVCTTSYNATEYLYTLRSMEKEGKRTCKHRKTLLSSL